MGKIIGPKGALLAGALAVGLTGCGGGGSGETTTSSDVCGILDVNSTSYKVGDTYNKLTDNEISYKATDLNVTVASDEAFSSVNVILEKTNGDYLGSCTAIDSNDTDDKNEYTCSLDFSTSTLNVGEQLKVTADDCKNQILDVVNFTPEALESRTDFERVKSSKYTFSMTDAISDIEDTDDNLEIIITKQPVYTGGSEDYQVGTLNIISADNVEFYVNDGEGGSAFFTYKVKDSQGKISEEKKYYLAHFDNS